MASEILAAINHQQKNDLAEDSIRWRVVGGFDNPSYAVIAKGNIFEGVEAKA